MIRAVRSGSSWSTGRPGTTPTAGSLGAANEVDDARWVPLGEALGLLTYDHDRRLLEGWQPTG
jgi:hypothetical protein